MLLLGGAGAYFMGFLDPLLGKEPAAEEMVEGEEGEYDEESGKDDSADKGDKKSDKKSDKKAGKKGGKKGDKKADKKGDKSEGEYSSGAVFLEIPNQIVNLNTGDGQPRYLRLSIQLELKSEEDKAKLLMGNKYMVSISITNKASRLS